MSSWRVLNFPYAAGLALFNAIFAAVAFAAALVPGWAANRGFSVAVAIFSIAVASTVSGYGAFRIVCQPAQAA